MPTEFDKPIFAGIDVGGTNIKIGFVDDQGQILADTKFPTQPDKSPDQAVKQARREFDQLLESLSFEWDDVVAAGLGTPGPMDLDAGTLLTPSNLPGWRHSPIREKFSAALELPVTYVNDAGAAAFGEYWVGGGQAFQSMVLLTLGTGVGGGIIVNDMSIEGAHSLGAEVGHMVIDTSPQARMCGCGRRGHLEAYASATAVVDRTQEAMGQLDSENQTVLRDSTGDDSPLSALMISNAAADGDPLAMRIVSETAVYLGQGIAQLGHIIDPAVFILGGAMNFGGNHSALGQRFLREIIEETKKHVFPQVGDNLLVNFAELGSEAGLVGAAGMARSEYNRNRS